MEEALSRCVDRLSISSKQEDLNVQVCMNIARCFSVSARFEMSREKLAEMPDVIRDLCRLLFYSVRNMRAFYESAASTIIFLCFSIFRG